ncbi:MAG TPA: ATP-binding protein [Pseudanabaena sp.]|nr:ATP-binding protein [Pseudanabaena sp.]
MLQHYQIRVNSDIYALANLQEWFLQFQNFLPKTVWMQCNLVLVEIFTNVVSYAHDGLDVKTPIDIELDINTDENLLELKIWDYGQPFDPVAEVERLSKEAQKNRDFENIDDIPTGGRGLIIAKMIADNIHYESISDGRNCFVMTKSFDPK